jgi:hypothetical protein
MVCARCLSEQSLLGMNTTISPKAARSLVARDAAWHMISLQPAGCLPVRASTRQDESVPYTRCRHTASRRQCCHGQATILGKPRLVNHVVLVPVVVRRISSGSGLSLLPIARPQSDRILSRQRRGTHWHRADRGRYGCCAHVYCVRSLACATPAPPASLCWDCAASAQARDVAQSTRDDTGAPVATASVVTSPYPEYCSRLADVEHFNDAVLGELHRRGVERATQVAAVSDEAEWIQGFVDLHCPQAGDPHPRLRPCCRARGPRGANTRSRRPALADAPTPLPQTCRPRASADRAAPAGGCSGTAATA